MTTSSLPLPEDPAAILSEVELFFDTLPATRRGRRIGTENDSPETENYGAVAQQSLSCKLDQEAQEKLHLWLWQLSRARSAVIAQVITMKICALLDISMESEAYEKAMAKAYRKGGK